MFGFFSRKNTNNVTFNKLYNKYKFTEQDIAGKISSGQLTPITPFTFEQTGQNNIVCSICYNFYPIINETKCCHQHICTECFAACIDPKTPTCPFCRSTNLSVTANQKKEDLKIPDFDDLEFEKHEEELRDGINWDKMHGFSDEIIAISIQYDIDPSLIQDLSSSGISNEEIIQIIQMQRQH